jgi:hypothetical protein
MGASMEPIRGPKAPQTQPLGISKTWKHKPNAILVESHRLGARGTSSMFFLHFVKALGDILVQMCACRGLNKMYFVNCGLLLHYLHTMFKWRNRWIS